MHDVIAISTAREQRLRGDGRRLERAATAGALVRVRRGAYVARAAADTATPVALHLTRVLATRLAAAHEPTFSHESAAALLGIPIVGRWPERTHTTVTERVSSSAPVQRSTRRLSDLDRREHPDGTRSTSPVRTAIDLAATRPLLAGIVAISHVRSSGVGLEEFDAALDRAGRFPGLRRARVALARSTSGSGSVLETLVVVRCQDYGFAAPAQRRDVLGVDGLVHRVDFAWEDGAILGVGDVRDKCDDAPSSSTSSAAESVWAARRREDALRPVSQAFVRLGWVDAWGGQGLARQLIAAGVPQDARRLVALTC